MSIQRRFRRLRQWRQTHTKGIATIGDQGGTGARGGQRAQFPGPPPIFLQQGAGGHESFQRRNNRDPARVEQRAIGGGIAREARRMRHRRRRARIGATDFQYHDRFARLIRPQRQGPEPQTVVQTVDEQADDFGGGVPDRVLHVIEHRHVGLVPGGREQRQPAPGRGQAPRHRVEQRPAMGKDRHAARPLPLRVRGIEADRNRMVRVVNPVAVRADDADPFLGGDASQFALPFGAARVQTFGIARRPDNDGLQARAGAVADGLHR